MKKKILSLALVAAMALSMVACGSSAEAPAEAPANDAAATETAAAPEAEAPATNSEYAVAMITDSGDITDQSFNQSTYEACVAFCEANGVEFKYYKPTADSDEARIASTDQAIAEGFNIIVMPGYLFATAVAEESALYPDVKFIVLDDGSCEGVENVYEACYQEELPGYMAGYAAVKLGYRHLGFLGGMSVPAVIRYGYGYVQGANAAAVELGCEKDVTVEYVYGGQFFGDADITAVMDTWYNEKGVEVVFGCGGGVYTSAAEVAQKMGGKIIGVDVDQKAIIDANFGDGITVTSAMKGLAATVNNLLSETILNGNWANYGGKVETLGIVSDDVAANYVALGTTQYNDNFSEADYKALVADMNSGKVTVSNDVEKAPEVAITLNEYGSIK